MTTTAHEDQFTVAPEPVRQTYSTADILRRNVADLEIALRKQTERAEKAEEELARLREQEPVAIYDGVEMSRYTLRWTNGPIPVDTNLYINPVPAPAVPDAKTAGIIKRLRDACPADSGCKCTVNDAASELERLSAMLQSAEVTK